MHQRATVSADPTHSREADPATRKPERSPSPSTGNSPWSGNQSRLRSLASAQPANSILQRKLAHDPLEIEADRTADRILRMPDQAVSAPSTISHAAPLTLHRCSCGGSSSGGSCDKCKDEAEIQRKHSGPTPVSEAPAIVHEVLRSPGLPLDPATRAFMEPRFGHDFSQVRIHSENDSAQSAESIDARAYTAGTHIAFGLGEYAPGTADGRRLLAHELTHVLQQTRMPSEAGRDGDGSGAGGFADGAAGRGDCAQGATERGSWGCSCGEVNALQRGARGDCAV